MSLPSGFGEEGPQRERLSKALLRGTDGQGLAGWPGPRDCESHVFHTWDRLEGIWIKHLPVAPAS